MVGKLDNEQMKMIWRNWCDEVLIEDVEVLRETKMQYRIQGEYAYRSRLGKDELDRVITDRIFTFDLPKAIIIWNKYQTDKISRLEVEIEKVRSLIIREDV